MPNDRGPRPPVIADVARLAEVSIPTVSRVLTGAARVTPAKRERVLAAIESLSYRPSAVARALVARKSRTIAVVAGNTSKYGYAETIRGIEESARGLGYTVTITVVDSTDEDDTGRALDLVLNQSPDGVAVLKFDPAAVAVLKRLPESMPVTAISGTRERTISQAVLDEAHAAEAVTEHLLGLGHATVHHVRVPSSSQREDRRTTGWRRALKTAGTEVPPILEATWDPQSGRALGHEIAARADVTAVFCGNDEIAMGVIKGLTEGGARVPQDVSVVGFDGHPLGEIWTPGLTTVDQDFADLGRRAFSLLQTAMGETDGPRFSSALPTLVLRESTAPPRQTKRNDMPHEPNREPQRSPLDGAAS